MRRLSLRGRPEAACAAGREAMERGGGEPSRPRAAASLGPSLPGREAVGGSLSRPRGDLPPSSLRPFGSSHPRATVATMGLVLRRPHPRPSWRWGRGGEESTSPVAHGLLGSGGLHRAGHLSSLPSTPELSGPLPENEGRRRAGPRCSPPSVPVLPRHKMRVNCCPRSTRLKHVPDPG